MAIASLFLRTTQRSAYFTRRFNATYAQRYEGLPAALCCLLQVAYSWRLLPTISSPYRQAIGTRKDLTPRLHMVVAVPCTRALPYCPHQTTPKQNSLPHQAPALQRQKYPALLLAMAMYRCAHHGSSHRCSNHTADLQHQPQPSKSHRFWVFSAQVLRHSRPHHATLHSTIQHLTAAP